MEFLDKKLDYFKIIRPKNLLIAALTQCIIYKYIILQFVPVPSLNVSLFLLLSLDTIIIAAGGYVINDILDFKSDSINKPEKTLIPEKISVREGYLYYILLLFTGLILAFYIAYKINNLPLVLIYPTAALVLYLYSLKFKNTILAGNIIVSIYVAFVTGIVLFFERDSVFSLESSDKKIVLTLFWAYMVFSFILNFIREVIKDIEDLDGDKKSGLATYPIRFGIQSSKKLCITLCLLIIAIIITFMISIPFFHNLRIITYLTLLIAAPLVIVIQILTGTTQKREFSKISTILKWIMVAGLGSIVLISTILQSNE